MVKKRIISIILCLGLLLSSCFTAVYAGTLSAVTKLDGSTVTVSGGGVTNVKKIVTVKITDPDGNIININQLKANDDGSFSYSAPLPEKSGTYEVSVFARGEKEIVPVSVLYITEGAKLDAAVDINEAIKNGTAETELAKYAEYFGIEEWTEAEIENAAEFLTYLMPENGYDFDSMKSCLVRSKTIFTEIKDRSEYTLTGFLQANKDILIHDNDVFVRYNSLSTANRRAVNNIILSGTYTDLESLHTAVRNAVESVFADIEAKELGIQADIDVNIIKIKGSGTETAAKIVTLKIIDPENKTININQIKAKDDGSFEYSAEISADAPSGYYTVSATSRGMTDISVVSGLSYLSGKDRNSITDKIEKSDADNISALLKENAEHMGITSLTDSEIKNAAIVLSEQKPAEGYTYEKILQTVSESKEIFDKVASSTWLTLDDIITANSDILLGNMAEYGQYSAKEKADRNKICTEILKNAPFADITAFRTVFAEKVSSFGSGTSGGSWVGGGGGATGGSKGSASSGIGAYTTPVTNAAAFDDLENHEWARESIEGLLKAGVVSPAADGKYRPADNITREEFTKLLVCAFSLVNSEAKCEFSDVSEDKWYYIYVASAFENKITEGRGDGSFGIGDRIKRQDMAVLVYRTVKALGSELEKTAEEFEFADDESIAEYAKEATYAMQTAGIINGDDTGNFRPDGNATRAEAAKVIYMLMKSIGQ